MNKQQASLEAFLFDFNSLFIILEHNNNNRRFVMQQFRKFNSLENTYNTSSVNNVVALCHDEEQWVVTEKLHGANFAVYKDGDVIRFASRNRFIEGDDFYELNGIDIELRKIFSEMPHESVIVYGELVGNHIQKEVMYADDGETKFFVFEVLIDGDILVKSSVEQFCENHSLNTVPVLLKSTLSECLLYPNTFNSTVLGIEHNEAEGVVIEPNTPRFFNNGKRAYLKNKSVRFSEKNIDIPESTDDRDVNVFNVLMCYLNENRINSVLSKGVNQKDKRFNFILIQDMIDDYNKDYCEDFKKEYPNYNNIISAVLARVIKLRNELSK